VTWWHLAIDVVVGGIAGWAICDWTIGRRRRRDRELATANEALAAALPRAQIRARLRRPGETLGRTIGCHDVDVLPDLVHRWAQLDLPDLELKPGDRLEVELLTGELDLHALFNVTAWSRQVRP
jgi:hypothetical protein